MAFDRKKTIETFRHIMMEERFPLLPLDFDRLANQFADYVEQGAMLPNNANSKFRSAVVRIKHEWYEKNRTLTLQQAELEMARRARDSEWTVESVFGPRPVIDVVSDEVTQSRVLESQSALVAPAARGRAKKPTNQLELPMEGKVWTTEESLTLDEIAEEVFAALGDHPDNESAAKAVVDKYVKQAEEVEGSQRYQDISNMLGDMLIAYLDRAGPNNPMKNAIRRLARGDHTDDEVLEALNDGLKRAGEAFGADKNKDSGRA